MEREPTHLRRAAARIYDAFSATISHTEATEMARLASHPLEVHAVVGMRERLDDLLQNIDERWKRIDARAEELTDSELGQMAAYKEAAVQVQRFRDSIFEEVEDV